MLAEPALDELRDLERILARAREEHEEFGRSGGEGDLHRTRTLAHADTSVNGPTRVRLPG